MKAFFVLGQTLLWQLPFLARKEACTYASVHTLGPSLPLLRVPFVAVAEVTLKKRPS